MKIRAFAVVTLGLAVLSAGAMAAEQRPQLKGVSAIRVANYGTPSTLIHDRGQVNVVVDELRQLRNRIWRRADTRFSCYATLVLLSGERPVALFRVGPELVVERPQEKGQSSYSLAIGQSDLPGINTLLTGLPPAKDCK